MKMKVAMMKVKMAMAMVLPALVVAEEEGEEKGAEPMQMSQKMIEGIGMSCSRTVMCRF
jgi:hypothetical protein